LWQEIFTFCPQAYPPDIHRVIHIFGVVFVAKNGNVDNFVAKYFSSTTTTILNNCSSKRGNPSRWII
jgi:hypothetical protein